MSRRQIYTVLGLTLVVFLVVAALDQPRPWKRLQIEARQARAEFLTAQVVELERHLESELAALDTELEVAVGDERPRRQERRDLEREAFRLERNLQRAESRMRTSKDDAERREARIEVEGLREMVEDRRRRLGEFSTKSSEIRRRRDQALAPLEDLRSGLASLERWAFVESLPGLRYLSPGLKVSDSYRVSSSDSGPATGSADVERCTTCHLGMEGGENPSGDQAGADFAAMGEWTLLGVSSSRVLGPHPRPELMADHAGVGCVDCHGGDGRATDLDRSGHTLSAAGGERDLWHSQWSWRQDRVSTPILAAAVAPAGCASCHGADAWISGAPDWGRSVRLARRLGCVSCHGATEETEAVDVDDSELAPRIDLTSISFQTTREQVAAHLADPRGARRDARMPAFWLDRPAEERDLEIAVLTAELWRRSQSPGAEPAPVQALGGDEAAGETLFTSLGCEACHVAGGDRGGYAGDLENVTGRQPAGLFRLLVSEHRPELRLTRTDASHLAAFLTAAPADSSWPEVDTVLRDRRLREALEHETTIEGAQAVLDRLDGPGRDRELADLLFARYSCAACHVIPGVAKPPPAPDFRGTRWPSTGLISTRSLLERRQIAGSTGDLEWFHGDAALGVYQLSQDEARLIETYLLGATRPRPQAASRSERATLTSPGRAVLSEKGCRACHVIEGDGGDLGPSLDRAASHLRSSWIRSVLAGDAAAARPWQPVRMPHFDLEPHEIDAVVDYFAARAGLSRTAQAPADVDRRKARAIGKAVFEVLQCGRCHGAGSEAAVVATETDDGREGLPPVVLAPDYRLSSQRLRPIWLRHFLLEPHIHDPGSTMPQIFPPLGEGRFESSYLIGSLGAPMFQLQRLRLVRDLGGESEMVADLSDAEKVASGLAVYLESLEPPASQRSNSSAQP